MPSIASKYPRRNAADTHATHCAARPARSSSRALLAAHRAPGDHLGDRGAGRVVERTQHAGDVAQRRSLEAAFAERARRFAFEVEDDEVATRVQHLTEVQVAVDADALAAGRAHHVVEPLEQLVGAPEDDREVRRRTRSGTAVERRRTRSVCCAVLRIDW